MRHLHRWFIYGVLCASLFWLFIIYSIFHTPVSFPSLSSHTHPHPPSVSPHHSPEAEPDLSEPDLSELAIISSSQDQHIRDEGYRLYSFNVLISDRLSLHRGLPDYRHSRCGDVSYASDLPSASVIVCFYNEAWSALLRTVHSVIDRSPPQLLHEIILVDDKSDLPHLGQPLDDYILRHLPQTRLVRTSRREGLIRARLLGASHATGEVLVFLDSHCEVGVAWLEPLLSHIHTDPHNVALPIIDIINEDSFVYEPSPLVRGGFNWGLFFRWDPLPDDYFKTEQDHIRPIKTPTMAGGLFAINKEFFNKLGQYDPGLDVWGGENLELSFKTWQCGGQMHIIPCSRVGHIFRKVRPYGSGQNTDVNTHNALRVALVWMDDYVKYFYETRPEARQVEYGDISERRALRARLQCHSFQWYLEHVYPEQTVPGQPQRIPVRPAKVKGRQGPSFNRKAPLHHVSSGLCVVSDQTIYTKKARLKLVTCDPDDRDQVWYESGEGVLRLAGTLCLDADGYSAPFLGKCTFNGGSQQWTWIGPESHLFADHIIVVGARECDELNSHKSYLTNLVMDLMSYHQYVCI